MKYSKYIYIVRNKSNTIILNTLYGNFLNIYDKDKKIYDTITNKLNYANLPKDVQEFLYTNHIVLSEEIDENNVLNDLIERSVNDNKIMNLIILPTEDCNFRCIYCYEKHKNIYMNYETQNRLIGFISDKINEIDGINIEWFGGEPMIALNLIESLSEEIKKICLHHKIKLIASMTTNGYILSVDLIKRLRKCNIYSYQITIDGFQETHDEQRKLHNGQGSWQRIINNLLNIKNNYHSAMLQISIRVNLSRKIYEDYKEFVDFLKENFADDNRFRFLFKAVRDYGNLEEDTKRIFITDEEYFEVLLYSLKQGLYNATVPNSIKPGGMLCYAFKNNSYVIQPDGTISKCTLNLYNDVNRVGTLSTGEYDTNNFFNSIVKNKNDQCRDCVKYPICLKANCNMMTHAEMQCEPDVEKLYLILPYICDERYGCINYIPVNYL